MQSHLAFSKHLVHLSFLKLNFFKASYFKNNFCNSSQKKMEYSNFGNGCNGLMRCQQVKTNASSKLCSALQHADKRKDFLQVDDDSAFNSAISNGHLEDAETAVNEEAVRMSKSRPVQNGAMTNGKQYQNGSLANGKHDQNESIANGKHATNGSSVNYEHVQNGIPSNNAKPVQTVTNEKCIYAAEERHSNYSKSDATLISNESYNEGFDCFQNGERLQNSVVVSDHLTVEDLQRLFSDQICVLHIPNYVPQVVCEKLDSFLQEKGSDPYTHEIRSKDGTANLQYFGVNRYGLPLNSTYNDNTGNSLKRYFSEALPTMQSIRNVAAPYLSPIDKLRVELDELWHRNVNVATFNGRKTFCGIGRIMPAILSELSADQPHFDAVPTSYFPDIRKQFAANIYLNVPEEGGELEIWDVPPVDVDNVENFTIPEDWRSKLPESIRVKPGPGDLLLLNTRRPHAITKFAGAKPRTSIQSFIGLTKESDVFLWV